DTAGVEAARERRRDGMLQALDTSRGPRADREDLGFLVVAVGRFRGCRGFLLHTSGSWCPQSMHCRQRCSRYSGVPSGAVVPVAEYCTISCRRGLPHWGQRSSFAVIVVVLVLRIASAGRGGGLLFFGADADQAHHLVAGHFFLNEAAYS